MVRVRLGSAALAPPRQRAVLLFIPEGDAVVVGILRFLIGGEDGDVIMSPDWRGAQVGWNYPEAVCASFSPSCAASEPPRPEDLPL